MFVRHLAVLAIAGFLPVQSTSAATLADSVIHYQSGTGFSPGYTNPAAALGWPSAQTIDPHPIYGGTYPVDPFNPPYLASQVVSVGAGGSLTLGFAGPVFNQPHNPFGLDFMIFGNNGFVITNGDYSGGGITSGSLFSAAATARVWVSADNLSFFELVAPGGLSATVDQLFPTDGTGDFERPVDPTLSNSHFHGQNLSGIRFLYAGSGGGTGFDLDWAQDTNQQPVQLPSISFMRIEVLNGSLEIDAAVAAVPEPSTMALGLLGMLVGFGAFRRR